MDLTILDENLNFMIASLELDGEECHLKHGPAGTKNPPAVDYLCQRLGNKNSSEVSQELRIPICKECAEALQDTDWILAYCTYCHKSQWIYRPLAKLYYPPGNGIYWMDVCPHCAEIATEYDGE